MTPSMQDLREFYSQHKAMSSTEYIEFLQDIQEELDDNTAEFNEQLAESINMGIV